LKILYFPRSEGRQGPSWNRFLTTGSGHCQIAEIDIMTAFCYHRPRNLWSKILLKTFIRKIMSVFWTLQPRNSDY